MSVVDREALKEAAEWWDSVKGVLWQRLSDHDWAQIDRAFAAAQAYADLLDSDPLIIRRDDIDYAAAERLFEEGADLDWLNDGKLVVDVLVRKVVDAALAAVVDTPKENR